MRSRRSPESPRLPDDPRIVRPAPIIAICTLIALLEGYDVQAFGVAAPRLVVELALTASQQGWAGSAAMIGLIVGGFLGGWTADRIGRRPVLSISVAMFGFFSVFTAFSGSFETLLLARLATGLGFGGAMPNLIAIASEISAIERRALNVTVVFCGLPAGAALVAMVARLYGPNFDWRSLFVVGGMLPLPLVPTVLYFLPETRPVSTETVDRNVVRALFGESRALKTLLVWSIFMLTLLVVYLMLNWLPTLVIAKGLRPEDGSSAAMIFNLMSIVGAVALAPLVSRFGFRWPLTLAYCVLAAVMMLLAAIEVPWMVLALSGFAGVLVVGPQCTLYALISTIYAQDMRGLGAGAAVGIGRFGSIAGPLVAGELRQAGWSAGKVFLVVAPLALIAAAAVFFLGMLTEQKTRLG